MQTALGTARGIERRSYELFGNAGQNGGRRRPVRRAPIGSGFIEHARVQLLAAAQGSRRAAACLEGLQPALEIAAGAGNAYACDILGAMCASGLGARRSIDQAREWIMRAVRLLEDDVRRPIAGKHGFTLLPSADPELAYRPLYTETGVLVTNEIGTARMVDGALCFDRWGRPVLNERFEPGRGPTHATPRSVAARIARESTLEDFAWACRRTTRDFRQVLIDARVIAHARMRFQRCGGGRPVAHATGPVTHAQDEYRT
jgi:hypothetical protein